MDYSLLAQVYARLEATPKRLEKTHIISQFLRECPDAELERCVLLLQARAFPSYEKETLGIASKVMIKTLASTLGLSEKFIEDQWVGSGDLGLVAKAHATKRSQQVLFKETLTVKKVFDTLRKLASTEGTKSTDTKVKLLSELFSQADETEIKYLVRTVLEDLRVGIAEGTLRDAIAWAYLPEECPNSPDEEPRDREAYKAAVQMIQDAYDRTNDFAKVAVLAKRGRESLRSVKLTVGVPVKVMLATREPNMEAAFARTGTPAQLEYKYDGFRVIIHKKGSEVSIFTRRLENVTAAFPDLVSVVRLRIKRDCILDGEAIGIDPLTHHYVPFQQISQRIRRKYNIEELSKGLPMQLVLFDMLMWDGEELLDKPQSERFNLLKTIVERSDEKLALATYIVTSSVDDANKFFREAKNAGCEGVMVKSITSKYRPGARVGDWVKQKEVMENLDLVIAGGEWGEGKRSGWITSFVLACKDEEGGYQEIGRVGTGLKEIPEEGLSFGEVTELLRPHIEYEKGRSIVIKPAVVVEVAYEEIQRSPSYSSGYALRFPRIIRNRSDERGPEDVTTLAYVEQLFAQQ
jgi:DNA ligase-1